MKISVCIPVKNRVDNLQKCVLSLLDCNGIDEIVIGDFHSTDTDWNWFFELDAKVYPVMKVVNIEGDFSIGKAKNVAAENSTGDILFFLDADLVVPQEVINKIHALVPQGYAYSPIMCMQKENRIDEEWGIHSFGQIAVTYEQWEAHKWEEWTSYGGEDNIFFEPYKNGKSIRDQVFGFIHLWHDNAERTKNYKDKPGTHLEAHNLKAFGFRTAREAAENAQSTTN